MKVLKDEESHCPALLFCGPFYSSKALATLLRRIKRTLLINKIDAGLTLASASDIFPFFLQVSEI